MQLQTATKFDNVNKRALLEVEDMDIDASYSSKKMEIDKGK